MIDETIYNECWKDAAWDGVWETASKIDEKGWTTEIRVPFSQIRFHNGRDQVRGFNFVRQVARSQELVSLVKIPKDENRMASIFLHLTGISGVKPSSRVELPPFTVGRADYLQVQDGDPFNDGSEFSGDAGLDFKPGLGSNLTVDGSVNPDFGQVEVDPAVVNLSEFETYYTEKRPFFIEGSEIFGYGQGGATNNWAINWSAPSFFYSRRDGLRACSTATTQRLHRGPRRSGAWRSVDIGPRQASALTRTERAAHPHSLAAHLFESVPPRRLPVLLGLQPQSGRIDRGRRPGDLICKEPLSSPRTWIPRV